MGGGAAARPGVHLRQAFLVYNSPPVEWRDTQADVPPLAASSPISIRAAELRDDCRRSRRIPAVPLLGPAPTSPSSGSRTCAHVCSSATDAYAGVLPHLDYDLQRFARAIPHPAQSRAVMPLRSLIAKPGLSRPYRGAGRVRHHRGVAAVSITVPAQAAARCGSRGVASSSCRRVDAFSVADHQIAHCPWHALNCCPSRSASPAARCRKVLTKRASALPARSPAIGRACRGRQGRQLVHLLPLPRRRPSPRLRAHRRDSPQAGLRPGRAVHRSPDRVPEACRGVAPGEEGTRHALPDGRHRPRCDGVLGSPSSPSARIRPRFHHVAPSCSRWPCAATAVTVVAGPLFGNRMMVRVANYPRLDMTRQGIAAVRPGLIRLPPYGCLVCRQSCRRGHHRELFRFVIWSRASSAAPLRA